MTIAQKLSRRGFLAGAAAATGGLSIGFHIPTAEAAVGDTPEINAWVVVKPDNTVVVRVARVEMGQGTLTGLAQLVAEELDADWSKVTTEYPTPGQNVARKRIWGDFQTAGSRGIRGSEDYVRKGGAAARIMLMQAAATQLKVPVAELTTSKSVITHKASGRSLRYGQVAAAAAKLEAPKEVKVKDPKDWTIAGKPLPRLDTKMKLDGSQIYSIDLKLPGMLNAAITETPVPGGKVKSIDAAAAEKMRGVKKVFTLEDNAVVVVADTWYRAKTALDAVKITWDNGANANVSTASIKAMLTEGLDAKQAFLGNKKGDIEAAMSGAAKKVEAVYRYPYQHHMTMEPMNATAQWTPDKCTVWTATQNAEAALATTFPAAGLPIEKCDVIRLNLGGGFGRRSSSHDFVRQTVLIAKQFPGTPVKLIWSREQDVLHGTFHPTTMCKLTGALDDKGNLVGLHMRLSGQSILAALRPEALVEGRDPNVFQGLNAQGPEGQLGYDIPNLLVDHAMRNPPFRPGFWRGVNNNQNAIYLECFIDEMAHAAGQDPLEFRRKMMKNYPKHLAVLNTVAEKSGWGKPTAPGVFRGISQHMGYGSYVAAVAEVSVSEKGALKIHRIVAATDCGHVVNPQQVAAQIEGSFAYGLSALLHGEMTVKNGRMEQENFDTYEVLKMAEMPPVESYPVPSGGFWGGVGEPTIFVAAPAVLNAIFAATGKRLRDVPLKNLDLRKA
jgi:isoquinoline 1-oxidoreductase beta subunit